MHDSRLSDHFTNSHTFKTTRPERLKREGSSLEEKMLSTEYSFRRTELCWLFKKTRGFFSNSNGQRSLFLKTAHKSAENQGSFHLRKNWRKRGWKRSMLWPHLYFEHDGAFEVVVVCALIASCWERIVSTLKTRIGSSTWCVCLEKQVRTDAISSGLIHPKKESVITSSSFLPT